MITCDLRQAGAAVANADELCAGAARATGLDVIAPS